MQKLNKIILKNHQIYSLILIALILVNCTSSVKKVAVVGDEVITVESLLEEMIDRDQITVFPYNNYQSLQASSYNRESISPDKSGWFADSDGLGFIRIEENNGKKEWVLMEDDGPGVITKIWAVCFYYGLNNTTGANINFYLDGAKEPTISTNFFKLVKGEDFVKAPLADYSTRAGNLYLPIPYAKSCKITMDQKAFYNLINYRKYDAGTKVKTFTMQDFKEAHKIIANVSDKLVNYDAVIGKKEKQKKTLKPNEAITFDLPNGNQSIREIQIKLSNTTSIAQALRSTVLSANFDGEETVWVPVGDFFNNVSKVQSYDMWERSVTKDGTMICRWVMPYEKTGSISLTNLGLNSVDVEVEIVTKAKKWDANSMKFYATWRMDDPTPTYPIYDWNFLEAEGKGVIVGDEWTVLNPIEGWWGEGDEKIYVDNDFEKGFPSHFGTGTEDYYGWAGGIIPTSEDEFSKPFLGNIIVADPNSKGYNVCSRTRSLDAIPFEIKIKFDVESSCGKRSKSHFLQYAQTTFWYGVPGVTHNRKRQPEMASAKLPVIADLEKLIKEATKEQYVVEGALEIEILTPTDKSKEVLLKNVSKREWYKTREKYGWSWGELSGDAYTNITFNQSGEFVEYTLTEQFEKSKLYLGATIDRDGGLFDIYVNGELKATYNFYSETIAITSPPVNLGECKPVNNAFVVKIISKKRESETSDKKKSLGLDFFIVENDFLKRK